MVRVLVAEGDATVAESLAGGLRRHGFDTLTVDTGRDALRSCHRADLVLLDLELSDLDGLEVCRDIRTDCDIPIIALAARGTELDRVLGLQAGADDYLVKPYGFRELVARIGAVMRRARPAPPEPRRISYGPLQIDLGARQVRLDDRLINVTRKEFDLLRLLATQPETVVSRKQIMSKVWDDAWASSSRTIDTHVSSLRSKLGAPTWIVTVRGVGLQFGGVGARG
ncbi:response regulator transcription factor [Plantactinospora sp. B6F1]|uniref:winged helix-turn-helix domain-containing protein n=1 Tax=Plantactinospora sp. B6F1 TaxID=3158971 RepID=UPI00102C6DF0